MDDVLTRKSSVLVALCHRRFAGERDSLVELFPNDMNVEGLLVLAARHRVYGLAVSALLPWADTQPPAVREEVKQIATGLRRRTAAFELERDRILSTLEQSGIRAVVLKGAALVGTIYPDAMERDLHDIDLLVAEKSLVNAVQALADSEDGLPAPGSWSLYRRHHFHIALKRASGVRVEVHWALAREVFPFQLDPAEVLRGASEIEVAGVRFAVPRPEHMILHLVIQDINESFGVLARFVDIDRIVTGTDQLDWDELVRAARASSMGAPLALALEMTRRLFDTDIPAAVLDELRPSAVVRLHLALMDPIPSLLAQRLGSGPTRHRLLRFWLTAGTWRRLRILLATLVPSKYDHFEEFRSGRPGPLDRIVRFGKFVVLELALLVQGTLSGLRSRKDRQTRFWSSHASSSERR